MMWLNGKKIIIWSLILSLLLPSFSGAVYASEVSSEIETVEIIQEEGLIENTVSENNEKQLNNDLENIFENEYVESKEEQENIITKTTNTKSSLRTVDEALAWVKSLEGKDYDYDGVYGAQCVDLIAGYYNYLGVPVASGNGRDYATNTLPTAYGWQRIKNGVPQKGDILVYTNGEFGHVAIYEDEKIIWHGRYDGDGRVQKTTTIRYDGFKSYWGVIRPKFAEPYHNPFGNVEIISGGEASITVGGWAIDEDIPTEPINLHVYIGGPAGSDAQVASITANLYRSDIEKAYPTAGGYHGFSATIPTTRIGENVEVYIYAINGGAGGSNIFLGSGSVTIADTTKPVIKDAYIKEYDKDGFTVVAEVEDNVGIQRVRFPTKTESSDNWHWYEGIKTEEGIYEYRVNISEFDNYVGGYDIYVYAYDYVGNIAEVEHLKHYIDITPPTVTNAYIKEYDKNGFTVVAEVEDNVGVTRVMFPTWRTNDQDGGDALWYEGVKQEDGTWKIAININDFDNVETTYQTHIYAYDAAENRTFGGGVSQYIDRTEPVISDVEFERVSADAVQVSCQVTDASGITKVSFPTWTRYNNQDDMKEPWIDYYDGVKNGSTYTYIFRDSEHNYETGRYFTHIYAWDEFGNEAKVEKRV